MITIKNVEYSDVKSLIYLANDYGINVEEYTGILLDNYIFFDAEAMEVNGHRAKYIIADETVKNSWVSNYTIIMTNDINKINEYVEPFKIEKEHEEEFARDHCGFDETDFM